MKHISSLNAVISTNDWNWILTSHVILSSVIIKSTNWKPPLTKQIAQILDEMLFLLLKIDEVKSSGKSTLSQTHATRSHEPTSLKPQCPLHNKFMKMEHVILKKFWTPLWKGKLDASLLRKGNDSAFADEMNNGAKIECKNGEI